MKYWKNGFYLEQDENNTRYEITDEYWEELLNGENSEMEITTDNNGKPILVNRIITEEEILLGLRKQREKECFSIINRGNLWYNKLDDEQLQELDNWYHEWLDVTETKIIPEKPSWLK